MATTEARNQGKTEFVKDVLTKNPLANTTAVNEAWTSSGREGSISPTLVNKQRSLLGLSGNLRATKKPRSDQSTPPAKPYTGKKRGRKPKINAGADVLNTAIHRNGTHIAPSVTAIEVSVTEIGGHGPLEELEADIDRLLFKVMGMGELTPIEESLRQTRRLLYRSLAGK
jgi:hypothetical protein